MLRETNNNTSAAGGFVTQSNGNLGAGSVSKLDVHSLLYPAAQTKVFAHLVLWFGQSNHMNIGYSSTDPAQVKRQISDMISRGIDGVVMVWYGPNNAIDRAAKLVMHEAETHPGFTFAIMVDNGAIRWNSCPGCNPQQALTYDLQYVEQTYFPSPAYLRVGGRPWSPTSTLTCYYTVDWNAAKAALASNPLFLFQHSRGFSHVQSDGRLLLGHRHQQRFRNELSDQLLPAREWPHQGKQTWGASYKGFNDKLASWGLNRIMDQRCGQTWLQTFAKINSLYNSTNQLAAMQLVTWNDYEEGTEIESGIDNCVSVSAALAGNSLQWQVSGSEGTIDHYRVYVSSDGQSLMPLTDQTVGTHALDMCGYSLAAGNYKLFVQAIGKPSLKNQISAAVAYAPQCGTTSASAAGASETTPTTPPTTSTPPPATASIALSASPSSVTIVDGQSGSPRITVTARSVATGPVSLSCSNLPAAMSCTFSPAVITPGSKAATSVLRISVVRPAHRPERTPRPPRRGALVGFGLGMVGVLVLGQVDRKRLLRGLALSSLIACALLVSSCAGIPGGAESSAEIVPGSYSIKVVATSATTQASTVAKITIR